MFINDFNITFLKDPLNVFILIFLARISVVSVQNCLMSDEDFLNLTSKCICFAKRIPLLRMLLQTIKLIFL